MVYLNEKRLMNKTENAIFYKPKKKEKKKEKTNSYKSPEKQQLNFTIFVYHTKAKNHKHFIKLKRLIRCQVRKE